MFSVLIAQPALSQSDSANLWAYQMMRVPANAAQAFTPGKTITIAIIDDALDLQHPLWKNNLYQNMREIPGNNRDDDGNGLVDDYNGWDFADNDADVTPPKTNQQLNHGTAVAGLFWQMLARLTGSNTNNFRVLPIKVKADATLNNYLPFGYKGIEYAAQQGAQVIVCCWSGGNFGRAEEDIVQKAIASGAIIVGAAGNFFALDPQYPGAMPACINITGVTRSYQRHPIANYGMFTDLAAPADSLYAPVPFNYQNGRYLSGTSASVPFVAATVAAMLSADATLNLEAIDRLLKNSATPLEEQNLMYYGNLGAGLLNIEALINQWKNNVYNAQYLQPEGYVWFGQLSPQQAVMVKPAGKYPAIKLFVPAISGKKLPDLRLSIFAAGKSRDTLWPGADLLKPMEIIADSLALFTAGKNSKRSADWLYYKAQTIDSSLLYCSGLQQLTATKGEITDGSGNLPYAGRCNCKWQLTAPEGKRIRIRFTELDTEAKIDYIYIFNGRHTNEPILAMFSGNELPPEITSWGNEVLVWFATNDKVHGQGWKLVYEVVD